MPREWVIPAYDGFESLQLVECDVEEPGPTDIRLRIEAFALNWGDADLMLDHYSFSFSELPARIGIEAAGIVEAVGSDVTGIEIGARYCTLPYFYDGRGTSADTVLINADYVTPAPESLSATESASIWMQFLTAYYPVVELAKAAEGVNIFAPAGTSTAGNAALQIGAMHGANMISSTRHARNKGYLMESGASAVYAEGEDDLADFLRDATDGTGIHLSFDPVGGDFMTRYGDAMAPGGVLIMYGLLSGAFPEFPVVSMFQTNAWMHTYSLFNYVQDLEAQERGCAFVHDAIAAGSLKPKIDRVYPMEGYVEAWRYLTGERTSYGKVMIETGQ